MNWKKIIKDSNGKAPTTPIKDSIDDEMYNKKKIGGENWDENLHMIMGILDEFHKMQTAVEKTGHIPSQMRVRLNGNL